MGGDKPESPDQPFKGILSRLLQYKGSQVDQHGVYRPIKLFVLLGEQLVSVNRNAVLVEECLFVYGQMWSCVKQYSQMLRTDSKEFTESLSCSFLRTEEQRFGMRISLRFKIQLAIAIYGHGGQLPLQCAHIGQSSTRSARLYAGRSGSEPLMLEADAQPQEAGSEDIRT
jgi:hypothetical protein